MTGFDIAASPALQGWRRGKAADRKVRGSFARAGLAAVLAGGIPAGCINIAAPEAPIVIELNINIRQEVIYRLAADAANTIDENEDIF